MSGTVFHSQKLCEDTWQITGDGSAAYLLAGDTEALVIDTGLGTENLRAYARSVCQKPVRMAANTCGSLECSGGNGYFDYVFTTAGAEQVMLEQYNATGLTGVRDDFQVINVKDGGVIRIGSERVLQVLVIDGHSPGSAVFLDEKHRLLFAGGDISASGGVMLTYKCPDPQPGMLGYAMALSRLMARRADYDTVLTADGVSDAVLLEHHLEAALRALEGEYEKLPADSGADIPEPEYKRVIELKGVRLVFDERYLNNAKAHTGVKGS